MADINQGFLEIPIYSGSSSFQPGITPFGYFDNDPQFAFHAPKVADYCARKLGYPIQDVELDASQFFEAFEDAVMEYGAQVNQFNIRENMFTLQGMEIGSDTNYSGKIITPNLGRLIQIAKNYGTEAGAGGNVEWRRGRLDIVPDKQMYDIEKEAIMPIIPDVTISPDTGSLSDRGKPIEIKRIFHLESQMLSQYVTTTDYNSSGISYDTQLLMDTFGFGNMAVGGASFLLTPLSYDLMRMQAIEFNQQIRRSAFSFEIIANKIKIFPIPIAPFKIYFDYILIDERNNPFSQYGSGSYVSGSYVYDNIKGKYVSDYSNVPYNYIVYSNINDVGKQWILKYTLANCKEILGNIRNKYSSVPLPSGEITLNGSDLISQSSTEKEALITQLRENLDQASRRMQLERYKDETSFEQESLDKIPLKIYIR